MAANPNGPMHEEVTNSTSTTMVDPPPYGTADQTRISPIQVDNQTHPQRGPSAEFIQDIQPIKNDHTPEGIQSAPTGGAGAVVTIQDAQHITPLDQLLEAPAWIDCPFCHQVAQTTVTRKDSSTTGTYALLCCLCCGIIGACIPYLCHWAQDTDHSCLQCGSRVTHRPHEGAVQVLRPPQAPPVVIVSKEAEAGITADQAMDRKDAAAGRPDQAQLDEKR